MRATNAVKRSAKACRIRSIWPLLAGRCLVLAWWNDGPGSKMQDLWRGVGCQIGACIIA